MALGPPWLDNWNWPLALAWTLWRLMSDTGQTLPHPPPSAVFISHDIVSSRQLIFQKARVLAQFSKNTTGSLEPRVLGLKGNTFTSDFTWWAAFTDAPPPLVPATSYELTICTALCLIK